MIQLQEVKRTDPRILERMQVHYSQPKGFVGRNICYVVLWEGICYGAIVGGSATRFLAGRDDFFGWAEAKPLNNIVNNIFFHIERVGGKYPCRWFSVEVIQEYIRLIEERWLDKYGDIVQGHETLVELPRSGECYRKAGWSEVGMTKGYTCKRVAGKGTDSWSGRRVWDTKNLRPKRVFACKQEGMI